MCSDFSPNGRLVRLSPRRPRRRRRSVKGAGAVTLGARCDVGCLVSQRTFRPAQATGLSGTVKPRCRWGAGAGGRSRRPSLSSSARATVMLLVIITPAVVAISVSPATYDFLATFS